MQGNVLGYYRIGFIHIYKTIGIIEKEQVRKQDIFLCTWDYYNKIIIIIKNEFINFFNDKGGVLTSFY